MNVFKLMNWQIMRWVIIYPVANIALNLFVQIFKGNLFWLNKDLTNVIAENRQDKNVNDEEEKSNAAVESQT